MSTTTTVAAAESTTTSTPDVSSSAFTVPTGTAVVEDGDVLIAHNDGDLWLHPGLLTASAATPVRLSGFAAAWFAT